LCKSILGSRHLLNYIRSAALAAVTCAQLNRKKVQVSEPPYGRAQVSLIDVAISWRLLLFQAKRAKFRDWHLADNPAAPMFVRYWDNSGQRPVWMLEKYAEINLCR
jgi:hypothetical protein